MSASPNWVLLGLVDASGVAGVAIGAPDSWRLVVHLAAWRPRGGPVSQDERRCEPSVSQVELRTLMEQIAPYQIVAVETERDPHQRLLTLRRIVELHAHDDELAHIAAALQQPITRDTARFGRLHFERRYNRFTGQVQRGDRPCALSLACADPQAPEPVLAQVGILFVADRVAKQDVDEVKHVKRTDPATGELDLLADYVEVALLGEIAGEQDDFGKPSRDRRHLFRVGVDGDRRGLVVVSRQLLQPGRKVLPCRSMEDALGLRLRVQIVRCATRGVRL